ncbi:MAG TPA: VOC family protein [Lactococcus sp.]|uniref:VOC family protein n=1 Tax=Lactococcus muris TaxID=2941330 RepID=A0ABV4DAA6_9LACT|nr:MULTISPECIES: VOC family protein [Lactococcus]MBL3716696.1 VOC family protein [Lactococcus garvieae]HAP15717.1 VOC family protein [Lactococcus sp.]HBC91209.1 VOC family protein [Lactococcus sp.]
MYKPNFDTVHHVAIIGSDYEKSRKFYVDIMGFSVIRENHRPDKGDIKIDLKMNDETEIELFIKAEAPERVSYPEAKGLRHLAIKTNNIEEDIAYLSYQGVKVGELRVDEITDKKMVFFYDPDDLPIELHE